MRFSLSAVAAVYDRRTSFDDEKFMVGAPLQLNFDAWGRNNYF